MMKTIYKGIAVSIILIIACFAIIVYYKPSILGQSLLSISSLLKSFRQFFGMQTSSETFVDEMQGTSTIPQQSGDIPGGGDSNAINCKEQQNNVISVFSEVKGYINDASINSNMSYYYSKYCGQFGINEDQQWSGILTVISDDGQCVLAVMNVTYANHRFFINSMLVKPTYVVVIDYAGFANVEQKFRAFANEVMQMEELSEVEIATKAFSLGETIYAYLLDGHIAVTKLN